MKIFFTYSILFLSLISSCSKTENQSFDYKYAYYPIYKGYWMIYDVDSILHVENGNNVFFHDTINYQIMELIDSSFTDVFGNYKWQFSTFRRKDKNAPWQNQRVGTLYKAINNIQKTENDVTLIKIVFPPASYQKWNINVYNNETKLIPNTDSICEFTEIDVPLKFGNFNFDSTVTLLQTDYEDLINKDFIQEKYAKNVGLIYRNELHVGKQNTNNPWTKPETGYEITYKLVDYKK